MNSYDDEYIWRDTVYGVDRGYSVYVMAQITKQELESGQFDSQTFVVHKYRASGGIFGQSQEHSYFSLSKMAFFDLWLGQKLQPTAYGADQPNPNGFTGLDSLASDFSEILGKDQNYFQSDPNAQTLSAKVRGLLDIATKTGFPTPQGALEQLADFVNGIISAVWSLITAVWDAIVNFVGSVANFLLAVWNNIVGPVLGAAIEVVKNVATLVIEGFKAAVVLILNSPISNNPFIDLNNEFINSQVAKTFLMDWQSFIPIESTSIDISSNFNKVKPIISTFNSLTDMLDLTKMIPRELSFFQDLFKLISPTLVYDIFINLLVDILTSSISEILSGSISSILSTDSTIISFYDTIITPFGNQISNLFNGFQNVSPFVETGPLLSQSSMANEFGSLSIEQLSLAQTQESTTSENGNLVSLVNSMIMDIVNFIDQVTTALGFDILGNLITNFGGKIFNLFFGIFYPNGIPNDSTLLIYSCLGEFLPTLLGFIADRMWGDEKGANLVGKSIKEKASAILRGIGQIFLDFIGMTYASAVVYMLNEFDNRIKNSENEIYTEKIAYLGHASAMVAFNLAGEFLEDIGKFFVNEYTLYDTSTLIANLIEGASEIFRAFVNLFYIVRYFFGFIEYLTSGFELSIPDFIYSIGYLAFLIATIQNLIANIYGFKENYGDIGLGVYTGTDIPILAGISRTQWDLIELLLPLTTGFTGLFGSIAAGLI
jgi:hypothetical protein